ncbi:MAG: amidohydrolase family protein [Planctomycetota bacterium]
MLVDAHHHLWKYDPKQYAWINEAMAVLKVDYLQEQLRAVAAANQIDGFVTVQARQSLLETETLLSIADAEPLIRGVVGWVDLAAGNAADSLRQFAGHSRFRGVRHVVQDEPDDRFLDGGSFNRGVALLGDSEFAAHNWVYDVLIFSRQLPAAIDFADRHPNIPLVIDHIAKPTIDGNPPDETWARQMRQMAERPNVTCKFSGIATEVTGDHWDISTVRPYWDVVLGAFGPTRLLFGSDWPVCLLRTEYWRWLKTVQTLTQELSPDERQLVMGGNAVRVYGLSL